jgi:glucoamylase
MSNNTTPPGAPGISPRWTSSAKSGVGKSIDGQSRVAFTLSHGILDEIYFPSEDTASIRDMEFMVTDGVDFFSEEKRDTDHSVEWVEEGIPAFKIVNSCKEKRYTIEKEIVTDPLRETVLQKITFKVTDKNDTSNYKLFMILSPHLNDKGDNNDGWVKDYKGMPMMFANRKGITLAVASFYADFIKRSVGFVGTSDGYTDIKKHKAMAWQYAEAHDGNIALTAEIDISKTRTFVIAIGFGAKEEEAGHHALASLLDGYDTARNAYINGWEKFQKGLHSVKSNKDSIGKNFRSSAAVLNIHESKRFPGGVVASLSIPWGETKGDKDKAGYHLVWPRDLVETSGGFLALDSKDHVLEILNYLMATQEANGRWSQNMWLEGSPSWTGLQMDEIALPIVLVNKCYQIKKIESDRLKRYWPGIKKAISFLIIHGPSTPQDRWEEEPGLTAFTLAAEISGLLSAAHLAEIDGDKSMAKYCLETADYWNDQIEKWTYVTDTPLSKKIGVDGYYIRTNNTHHPADVVKNQILKIKNRNEDNGKMHLWELVSVDALALVRFGLRAADDPKILNTIKVIDATLKVETPNGPCWHRYTNDGYGEDKDGAAFSDDGLGIGRAWPLLAGERGHYEVAAGNIEGAREILKSMDRFSNNGLLSEQIWDTDDIPEKELFFGHHSGSAMPLVWAHSEYIKLCCSIKEKYVFDMSPHSQERYIKNKVTSPFEVWRFSWPCENIPKNKKLRIEVMDAAIVHWTLDNWKTKHDTETMDTRLGIHVADIDLKKTSSKEIRFTFFWKEADKWENKDFKIPIILK